MAARFNPARKRILLTAHAPLEELSAGHYTRELMSALQRAGHQVRVLTVDRASHDDSPQVRRIICHPQRSDAQLSFELPRFVTQEGATTFTGLNDQRLVEYLEVLRQTLDDEVEHFDPHLIHAQHLWLFAHLALEAGVPYVATVWREELLSLRHDGRCRRMVQEAAENAGRLLVSDAAVQATAQATLSDLGDERFNRTPTDPLDGAAVEQLDDIYRDVLEARFGPLSHEE